MRELLRRTNSLALPLDSGYRRGGNSTPGISLYIPLRWSPLRAIEGVKELNWKRGLKEEKYCKKASESLGLGPPYNREGGEKTILSSKSAPATRKGESIRIRERFIKE